MFAQVFSSSPWGKHIDFVGVWVFFSIVTEKSENKWENIKPAKSEWALLLN